MIAPAVKMTVTCCLKPCSARDQLYISWVGRSIRDNSERPASVLIGQLRDHLAAGWRLAGAREGCGKILVSSCCMP